MRQGASLAAVLVSLVVALSPAQASAAPTATGGGGAAATVDRDATKAAIKTLKGGGNAVDAAVAAAGVLGVTEPYSSGIGGGGYMLIRTPSGRVATIDGRETAPAAATETLFQENGQPYPFAEAVSSGLSVGAPGTVATWDRALNKFGTESLKQTLKPGIDIARKGFKVDQTFISQTQENAARFSDIPSTREIYLPGGAPPALGSTLKNPDLARAYRRISKEGRDGFYEGAIAEDIAEAAQDPPVDPNATGTWRPGLLTADDIASYRERARKATRVEYRGLNVYGMRPSSSGGATIGEALNILEGFDPLGADRVQALHRYLDASRLAYADRGEYIGDRSFVDVPLRGLLSNDFAAERRALIGNTALSSPAAPGDPTDNGGDPRAASAEDTEGLSTTHLTVADDEGRIVSYTFTIEQTGGSGIVVPGWGFLLNNELTDFQFAPTPGSANPNLPEGGKRPRSSMSPTIVTKANGKPLLALGSPGGSTIITTVLQVLIERLDLGKTLPEAIAAPRVSQRNTAQSQAEPAFNTSADAVALETTYGHNITQISPPEIGAVAAIEFLSGGNFLAAAEPERRGGGSAMVVKPAP